MLKTQDINGYLKNGISLYEIKPGIIQVSTKFYHEDGDMIEIYLTDSPVDEDYIRVSDFGMTLMRLSYSYELNTPSKESNFHKILDSNGLSFENGSIYIDIQPDKVYNGVMHLAQAIAKVSSMKLFQREIVQSMFFEDLKNFIFDNLSQYNPQQNYQPIENDDNYEVPFCFNSKEKPLFLFGVNNPDKAKVATMSCLKFLTEDIKFRSIIVLENIDVLTKKDLARLMSAADKEFPSMEDFKQNALNFMKREYN